MVFIGNTAARTMTVSVEKDLIVRVKNHNDSDALQLLIQKYQPMIDNMHNMYWLNGYDKSDWYQESYIVCYETCQKFDGTQGSRFANFFKMRFNNHIVSLIRAQRAAKRAVNVEACSYEELLLNSESILEFLHKPAPRTMDLINHLEMLIEDLSDLELAAFQVILGDLSMQDVCERLNCTDQQLIRAASRCKTKISRRLNEM